MGTVLAGRHDTPYKLAKGGVDVFNDYDNVGLGNLMAGENRADNVLAYKSPAIVGMPLTFMAAVALSENDNDAKKVLSTKTTTSQTANLSGTKTVVETVTANDTKTKDNAYSASLAYDENGVYLAGGYDNNVGAVDSAWRLAGSVDMGKMNMVQGLTLGALYQNSSYLDGVYTKVTTDTSLAPSATNPKTESSKKDYENEKSWLLSAKYKFNDTPWAVKAQYINTSNYKGEKDTDATEIALGAEYTINKAAKAHMYAAQINTDKSAKNADIDKTIVGAGLEYKF
jgi:predicted porin